LASKVNPCSFAIDILKDKQTIKPIYMKHLKIQMLAIFALSVLLLSSCGKKIRLEKSIDSPELVISVPAHPKGEFKYTESAKVDIAAKMKDYGASIDDIKNVTIESVELIIEDPMTPSVTWDIVDNLNLDLMTSTIPSRNVASMTNVPHSGLLSIMPTVASTTELLDFAKANDITYVFSGNLNADLNHDITVRAKIKYHVVAEVAP
jgi:hypothetical protein